jgi:chromosome segregation ATPase
MDKAMNAYLSNLSLRDRREQANASLIHQYTQLADRTASVEAKLLAIEIGAGTTASADTQGASGDLVSHLRAELASAREELARTQQSETTARERVTQLASELETTRKDVGTHTTHIEKLTRQVALLTRKLKDRDAEAREQRKLIERIQDEMVGLNLEKNMAEQKKELAEKELEELEGRLMEWKRKEAEKMNDESRW